MWLVEFREIIGGDESDILEEGENIENGHSVPGAAILQVEEGETVKSTWLFV